MVKVKIEPQNPSANLASYDQAYNAFVWKQIEKTFTWYKTGRLNIVQEAVDRHAADPQKKDHPALIFEKGEKILSFSFAQMQILSCKWANLLSAHGFQARERLFILLSPCPEIYLAMLACARLGVIFSPLFTSLSSDELKERIADGAPRAILTHPDFIERLPPAAIQGVQTLFLTRGPLPGLLDREVLVPEGLAAMPDQAETRWLPKDAPLYLIYTSGSTGPPKGVVHVHYDMVGILATAQFVLDLRPDSVVWADCEPAWVNGTVYGALAPWLCGVTNIVQGGPFSASNWYRTLEKHQVSVWYSSPSILRQLMEAGADLPGRYDLSHLRQICTVGEKLQPELFFWVRDHIHLAAHDNWWMTETGMICLANFPSMAIKPGSMGKPVPGIAAAVVDEQGSPLPPMSMGELVLKPGWPAMMTAIWKDDKRYRAYFGNRDWFHTGDMVIVDEQGYYFHQGRMDDLIKVGVKLVGPYEIERALCRHPAVHEAAVIAWSAAPGEPLIKAYVTCHPGIIPSARLNREIRAFVKAGLASDITIQELVFIDNIPKTLSGKILRRVLRAMDMGLPVGDPQKLKDD
jgi:acetyl-CoA synthetase